MHDGISHDACMKEAVMMVAVLLVSSASQTCEVMNVQSTTYSSRSKASNLCLNPTTHENSEDC